jgi:hypothetical protein
MKDSQGTVIFDPFLISPDMTLARRMDWYAKHRQMGSHYVVLAPRIDYWIDPRNPYPLQGRDLLDQPDVFAAYVREAVSQPAADGKGFRVLIQMDEGAPDPRPRIDTYWKPIVDALADLKDTAIRWSEGWELVKASYWNSSDYNYGAGRLREFLGPKAWIDSHLSVDRWSWGSNPVEPTDPVQGGESAAWKNGQSINPVGPIVRVNGDLFNGFLYQAEPVLRNGTANCDPASSGCYLNRLLDGLVRMGTGNPSWRQMPVTYFEQEAAAYIRDNYTEGMCHDTAEEALKMALSLGITNMGFGNGLPWSWLK